MNTKKSSIFLNQNPSRRIMTSKKILMDLLFVAGAVLILAGTVIGIMF